MPTPQRLPIVNSDDGVWGDILRQYLLKEHYDDGTDNAANGGHKTITIQPGTASAGTAPLKFTSGTLLTTPEAGAMEFAGDNYYLTDTSGPTRRKIAAYDDTSGATGDIYYRNSSGYFTRLGAGSTGDLLTISGGLPSWSSSISNASTITLKDTNFTLQDNTDTTKQLQFELSGISASTTRTLTVPDANTTLVGTDTTDTLSNKTLADPVFTGQMVGGDYARTEATLHLKGGASGSPILQMSRGSGDTASNTFDFAISGGGFSVRDVGNSYSVAANFFANSTAASAYIGQAGSTVDISAHAALLSAATHSSAAGTDVNGPSMTVQGGLGTGAGTPGTIYFKTGDTTTSGTTPQISSTRAAIDGSTGVMTITTPGTVAGSVVSIDGTQTLTNKTITSPKVNALYDTFGNQALAIASIASMANYWKLTGSAATGSTGYVAISGLGSDTNVTLQLVPKGSGKVEIFSPTGQTPTLVANGPDANYDLNLTSKGTGVVKANGVEVATISGTQTLTNKTISGASNTLSNIPQSAIANLDMHLSSLRTGANLVTNPGFELDLYLGAYGAYDSSVKRNGTRSVRIDSDGSAPNIYHVTDATYSLTYPCQDGETFYFEEWVYGDAGNTQTTGWIELCVVTRNSANVQQWRNQQFAASTSYNGTWTKLSATLQISQADVQWVSFLTRLNAIPTGDSYWFDDPIVYRVGVPGSTASPGLLAVGGSDTNIDLNLTSKGTGVVKVNNVEVTTISGTQTLTNKTLTSPVIDMARDSSGNAWVSNAYSMVYINPLGRSSLQVAAEASSVNYLRLTGAATGNAVQLAASGTDTNVSMNLVTKGSGTVQANGVDVVTISGTQTLTNKTIDASSNTISNLDVADFAASAIVTESEGIASNDNDTTIPTSAAVKDYVDAGGIVYATTNTAGTYNGQYTPILEVDITAQYTTGRFLARVLTSGAPPPEYVDLDLYVDQWDVLGGSDPTMTLKVKNATAGTVDEDQFIAVLTTHTGSQSTVTLYAKIDDMWKVWLVQPKFSSFSAGVGTHTWLASQSFVASLPGGTQSAGVAGQVTINDDKFVLQDNSDKTKQLQFELSGITTATTRTLTVPDASTTLVGTDATQTLTNKTISGSSNTLSNIGLSSLDAASYATAATASTLAQRDANANLTADNFVKTSESTVTSGGTKSLTVDSAGTQIFTGSSTHTVQLPSTGVVAGMQWTIINQSSSVISIQSSNGGSLWSSAYGRTGIFTAVVDAPTTTGGWTGVNMAAGKTFYSLASLALTGTDFTTFTFPSSSGTVTTLNATQTLTNKTISGASNTISNIPQSAVTGLVNDLSIISTKWSSGTNILPNQSFANTNLYLGGTQASYSTDQARSGVYSLKLTGNGVAFYPALSSTTSAPYRYWVKPDSTYYVEMWVYGHASNTLSTGSETVSMGMWCYDNDSVYVAAPRVSTSANTIGTGAWVKVSGIITIPAGAVTGQPLIYVTGLVTTGNIYYVDDVVMYETSPILDKVQDSNDNTILSFSPTASAVNYIAVSNNATSFSPGFTATGSDTNINLDLNPKGSGKVRITGVPVVTETGGATLTNKTLTSPKTNGLLDTTGQTALGITATGGTNYLNLTNSTGNPGFTTVGSSTDISMFVAPKGTGTLRIYVSTGNTPTLTGAGPDANHNLNLVSQGTGKVQANGVEVVTVSGTQTLTNKTLTSPTLNGPLVTSIKDTNGANALVVDATASGVNYTEVRSGTTGNANQIRSAGSDTNISMMFVPKGSGSIVTYADTGQVPTFDVSGPDTNIALRLKSKGSSGPVVLMPAGMNGLVVYGSASAQNYLVINAKTTGNAPSIGSYGSDTDVSFDLTTKGAGVVKANGNPIISSVTGIPVVTGTPSSSTYLRGDGTWATLAGGGDMAAATYDPATISEQVVGLTATQTLTNKTLTAPKFANAGYIADANGATSLAFYTNTSAVNYFFVSNAATGSYPSLGVGGSDTNIGYSFTPKGTGTVQIYENAGQTVATLAGSGSATNVDLNLTSKGSGLVKANDVPVMTSLFTNPLYTPSSLIEPVPLILCENNYTFSTGEVVMLCFTPAQDMTVSNIISMGYDNTTQTSSTVCKVGIYQIDNWGSYPIGVTCIARSATKADRWNAAGLDTAPIVDDGAASPNSISSVTLYAGQDYAIAGLTVGHTGTPKITALGSYRPSSVTPTMGFYGGYGFTDLDPDLSSGTGSWYQEWIHPWFGLS